MPLDCASWADREEARSGSVEGRHEEALHDVSEARRGSPHHQVVAVRVARDRHRFHQRQIDVGHLDDRARGQAIGREALDSHAIEIGGSPSDRGAGDPSARDFHLGDLATVVGQHQRADVRSQRRIERESEEPSDEEKDPESHRHPPSFGATGPVLGSASQV